MNPKNKNVLLIIIGAVILILALGGIYYFWQKKTSLKKSDPCQYCSQIKCSDCKRSYDICRSDKTGCTSCNTDADCSDTHFCSSGAGCFLKESEIRKRAQ